MSFMLLSTKNDEAADDEVDEEREEPGADDRDDPEAPRGPGRA